MWETSGEATQSEIPSPRMAGGAIEAVGGKKAITKNEEKVNKNTQSNSYCNKTKKKSNSTSSHCSKSKGTQVKTGHILYAV